MPVYEPKAHIPIEVDDFVRAYLECAEWCGIDESEREAFEAAEGPEWSPDSVREAEEECRDFIESAGVDLDGIDDEQAGHDFWLTRNRHGAGFWDRGLGECGKRLTNLARCFGGTYVLYDEESETLTLYP